MKDELTAAQAAERLGVGHLSINLWCGQGLLTGARREASPVGCISWLIPQNPEKLCAARTQGNQRLAKGTGTTSEAARQKGGVDGVMDVAIISALIGAIAATITSAIWSRLEERRTWTRIEFDDRAGTRKQFGRLTKVLRRVDQRVTFQSPQIANMERGDVAEYYCAASVRWQGVGEPDAGYPYGAGCGWESERVSLLQATR